MGLLSQGSPLSWEETQRHAEHVRRHGILQFLHIYRAVAERHKDVLKWGDETHKLPNVAWKESTIVDGLSMSCLRIRRGGTEFPPS